MTRRVLAVFGTRPEAIKMAPVVMAAARHGVECQVAVTAQHRELLDKVLRDFDLRADYDLDIMQESQSLTSIATGVLQGMQDVLDRAKPELVLVHGDTSTTLYAAIAAYYRQISVGHVEAGLRSGDKYSPWPEEMNRQLADRLSDLLFAPTPVARAALERESCPGEIFVTGNTVIDAVRLMTGRERRWTRPELGEMARAPFLVVVEAHRRENIGERHRAIFRAIRRFADLRDVQVAFSVHPNPAVQEPVREILSDHPRIHLLEPLDYPEFMQLVSRAKLVLTDSGGLQEECPALGVPLLLLRDTSERPEAIAAGVVRMVGYDEEDVLQAALELYDDPQAWGAMAQARNPFGDGKASDRIWQAVLHWFGDVNEAPAPFL